MDTMEIYVEAFVFEKFNLTISIHEQTNMIFVWP